MWSSRSQIVISLSRTESDYEGMVDSVKDIWFTRRILGFIGSQVKLETVASCKDNRGATHLANNSMGSARSKNIDIRHHSIRDIVRKGDIRIVLLGTKLQHANLLTKNLNGHTFRIRDTLGFGRVKILLGLEKQGGCPSSMTLL